MVVCKVVIYHFIFPKIQMESSYYFIYGRQLFSALDNFMGGMFLAAMPAKDGKFVDCCGFQKFLGGVPCADNYLYSYRLCVYHYI